MLLVYILANQILFILVLSTPNQVSTKLRSKQPHKPFFGKRRCNVSSSGGRFNNEELRTDRDTSQRALWGSSI
jgi:hypothetical protein